MKVEFSAVPKAFSGNVAVFVAADKQLLAAAQGIDASTGGAITRALEAGRFSGAKDQTVTLLGQSGDVARLLLLGVGKGRDLDARAAEGLGGVIAGEANASGHKSVTVVVDAVKGSRLGPAEIAARIALGARLRTYRFDRYKTKDKPEQKLSLEELTIHVAGPADARRAYQKLEPTVDAVFFTRDLVRTGFMIFLPFLLRDKGADLPTIGLGLSLLFAGGAAGKLVMGWVGDRLGVVTSVVLTEVATTILILALLPMSLSMALILLPAVGLMLNGTSSVLYGTVPEFVSPDRRTQAFAIFYTGGSVAGATGPLLSGLLGDAVGLPVALAAVSCIALTTVPMVWALRPAFRDG